MITTSQFFVLLLATLSSSFPMTAAMGQQTVPPVTSPPTPTAPSVASSTTLSQITDDNIFSLHVPQGWVIQDINNTGYALLEEARLGYGILARLCQEEAQRQGAAISVNVSSSINNTSRSNNCETAQELVHVIRYPDLETRIQPADNITTYHLQKLQEVGYSDIQAVDTIDMRINLTNPQTQQTVTTIPAKFVEMTYSTASAPDQMRRGYFILTATDWTAPNVGTTKGYSIFYEGNDANITTAARPGLTTQNSSSSASLAPTPLPPAAAQILYSFELKIAPEVAQPLAQQAAQDESMPITNTTGTNGTQIAETTETSENEEVGAGGNDGDGGGDGDGGDDGDGGGDGDGEN
jgi:hypothetical protein